MGMNMAAVPDGAPPVRQAFSLVWNSSSGLTLPSFMALKSTASVVSLLMLAGGTSSSAACWNRIDPVS